MLSICECEAPTAGFPIARAFRQQYPPWPLFPRRTPMPMTDRVKQILSFYGSDNPGVRANLARMMNHGYLSGTGKLVILPVDQGFEHGPARSFAQNPAGYDPDYHVNLAIDS